MFSLEADIRKKGLGTFHRAAAKKRNSSKWRHKAYRGGMQLERGLGEVVLAEIHAPAPDQGICYRRLKDLPARQTKSSQDKRAGE